jgi:hypothetical protein
MPQHFTTNVIGTRIALANPVPKIFSRLPLDRADMYDTIQEYETRNGKTLTQENRHASLDKYDWRGRMVVVGFANTLEVLMSDDKFMTVFSFDVKVATSDLDCEVVTDTLMEALREGLPDGTLVLARPNKVMDYSEQGWKNARKRVFNISVADAGDAIKTKARKVEVSASSEEQASA